MRERDERDEPNVGLVVLIINVHAYLLGAVAFALPNWVAVAITVATVLLLTGRERLHDIARRLEMQEIVTAGQFLILTGIILPLRPAEPVTTLTSITPRQAWLALVVVCALSYVSYLAQRYWTPAAGGLWTAALGGLYSSTATTIVLARHAMAASAMAARLRAGITLATGIMYVYVRILVIVAVFNMTLAQRLAIPLLALFAAAAVTCALQTRWSGPLEKSEAASSTQNPLELGAAAIFAVLFVLTSLLSHLFATRFGITGVYALAAVIGFTDIDPFVLNLAQGGASGIPGDAIAPAILIAASSNNVLKAGYAALLAGGATVASAAILIALAAAGIVIAVSMAIS